MYLYNRYTIIIYKTMLKLLHTHIDFDCTILPPYYFISECAAPVMYPKHSYMLNIIMMFSLAMNIK